MNWVLLSIGTAFSFGIMAVLVTTALKQGINLATVMLLMAISWLLYFGYNANKEGLGVLNTKTISLSVLAAFLTVIGNEWQFTAMKLAPNPGLASPVIGGQIIITAIVAYLICGDNISIRQWLGIILALCSIGLISYK